ncbi:MAG: hypothetical protein JWQ38_3354 [Flavipsychrobacter sp.]|nr:hypothetical protein [Flavipsychrobacter sp.]
MKKLFPIALIAFAAMTFTSCKKDYTCTCSGTGVTITTVTIPKTTKSDAKSKCSTLQAGWVAAGATTATCGI